jgi:hypothetical protein
MVGGFSQTGDYMSADNWTTCPKCKQTEQEKRDKQRSNLRKSYGKVDPLEYEKLLTASKAEIALDDTLREDYEIGVDSDGCFDISYSCSCTKCDFRYTFKHSDKVVK